MSKQRRRFLFDPHCPRPRSKKMGLPYVPSELLCAIFQPLGLHGRIQASHVCKTWRAAAVEDPTLWNDLRFREPFYIPPVGLATLLNRTKSALVALGPLSIPSVDDQLCALVISSHIDHICVLELYSSRPSALRGVVAKLAKPAPVLTALRMTVDPGTNESGDVILADNLFRGVAPLLRDVFLFGVHVSGRCPAFRNVAKLALHPFLYLPTQTCLSDSIPALETLVLSGYDGPQYTLSPGHCLTELTITTILDGSEGAMEPYLSALQHSEILKITVNMADAVCMRTLLDGLVTVTGIDVRFRNDSHFGLVTVDVYGGGNKLRYFPIVEPEVVEDVLRSSASYTAHATGIQCPEFLLHAFAHHPLPLLNDIEVAFYRGRLRRGYKPSDTFAPALKTILRQEHTPVLVDMMISADSARDATIVPIDALPIVEALQIRTTTPKLARILVERTVLIDDRCNGVTVDSLVGALELFVSSDDEREMENGWSDGEDSSEEDPSTDSDI